MGHDISSTGAGGPQKYEAYLENWRGDWKTALGKMHIDHNTVIDIAFSSFNLEGGHFGGMNELTDEALRGIITYVHSQGGTVKMSFGGADPKYWLSHAKEYPNIGQISQDIISVMKNYAFDGMDFDLEDRPPVPNDFAKNASEMIRTVRAAFPFSDITLTVPGQAWGTYWADLVKQSKNDVTSINFMEYELWIDKAHGNSYIDQIKSDMQYYHDTWGIPWEKMHLGLMPGDDSMGNHLSTKEARALAQYAKDMGMGGVMLWDLDIDYDGKIDNAGSFAFQNAILDGLNGQKQDRTSLLATQKMDNSDITTQPRRRRGAKPHVAKGPPPEGFPPISPPKSKPRNPFGL